MKARVVHTKIWDDNWFLSLSRSSRMLFIYLITNQSIGLSGIYELPDSKIIYQTGLNSVELEQGKIDLKDKVGFHNGWVKIHNVEKYQQFRGPKNEKAKENEIKLVPKEIIDTLSILYRYPIDTTSNQYSVISNKKSVISNNDIEKYLETFNEVYETKYKSGVSFEKNFKFWRNEYSLEEILKAVKRSKNVFWAKQPTPELLLRTRNKNGECDYIGEILNTKSKEQVEFEKELEGIEIRE